MPSDDEYDPEKLAKAAQEFLQGKMDEDVFLSFPTEPQESEPFTMEKLLEAKAKLDLIGPIAKEIRLPMWIVLQFPKVVQHKEPLPFTSFYGFGTGIAIKGDWDLMSQYIIEYTDGSREVKWCGRKALHSFLSN